MGIVRTCDWCGGMVQAMVMDRIPTTIDGRHVYVSIRVELDEDNGRKFTLQDVCPACGRAVTLAALGVPYGRATTTSILPDGSDERSKQPRPDAAQTANDGRSGRQRQSKRH